MSDSDQEDITTIATESETVGEPKVEGKPCTGPLKSNKEGFNFKDFLEKSVFGKAQEPKPTDNKKLMGWGQYETEKENNLTNDTNPPFPDSSVLGKCNDDIKKMEDCTENRKTEDQKFNEKEIEGGYTEYELKPVKYENKKFNIELDEILGNLKEYDDKKSSRAFDELKEEGDGEGVSNFLKELFKNESHLPSLFKEYGEFLKGKDEEKINEYYDKIQFEEVKLADNIKGEIGPFKALLCFSHYKAVGEDEMKGGADDDLISYEGDSKARYKIILVRMMAIFGLIYFAMVFFEAARLFGSGVNKALDAREAYYQALGGDRGDNIVGGGDDAGFMSYLYGIYSILGEIASGTFILSLQTFENFAVQNARQMFTTIADRTGESLAERCSNGMLLCFNGFFTGDTQGEAAEIASITRQSEMNRMMNEAVTEINVSYATIKSNTFFALNGFITSVNGMLTCCVVLGNTIDPEKWRIEHVAGSVAALRAAYSNDSLFKYGSTLANLSILFVPGVYQLKGESSNDDSVRSESSISQETKSQENNNNGIFSFLTGPKKETNEESKEESKEEPNEEPTGLDALAKASEDKLKELSLEDKPPGKGGKRKTGKKLIDIFGGAKKRKTSKNKKKRKTVKKKRKDKKGKTKKRKTIKKRRKAKK